MEGGIIIIYYYYLSHTRRRNVSVHIINYYFGKSWWLVACLCHRVHIEIMSYFYSELFSLLTCYTTTWNSLVGNDWTQHQHTHLSFNIDTWPNHDDNMSQSTQSVSTFMLVALVHNMGEYIWAFGRLVRIWNQVTLVLNCNLKLSS